MRSVQSAKYWLSETCECVCNTCKSGSSLRRIQQFITEYALDTDIIARLIFKMLPHQPPFKLILVLDRTNWKFEQTNINVLTLAIAYQGVAFPILIKMLDKRGSLIQMSVLR